MLRIVLQYLVRYPILTLYAVARHPGDLWGRVCDDLVYAREQRRPPCRYEAVADWEKRFHEFLGVPWPCATNAECSLLWPSIINLLSAKGIRVGPESYLYWNDGDPALIRALWCLVRHLRPQKIVETGVAHGMTSRFILEALKKNGTGGLWSIDLPPFQPAWQDQVGIAVVDAVRQRWSLIRGSSRQRLAPLLSQLGSIDLFIHDSLHSERNLRFELDRAWAALKPGGVIVVDDVDASPGFDSFLRVHRGHFSLVCEAEPLRPDRRRFNEKGLFGIILKRPLPRTAQH
jgi:predicted O-methyltransferase YrrM